MMLRTLGLCTARRRSFSNFGSNSNNEVSDLWKRLLAGVHAPSASQEHYFKDLVATGISLNKGRHQNLFPDEIVANFRSYYSTLDLANKNKLFHSLATVFSLDKSQIDAAVEHWHAVQSRDSKDNKNITDSTPAPTATASLPNLSSDEASLRAAERLYQSTQPLYSRLWTPLAQQHHDGLSFLVDLRSDLLKCISKNPAGVGPLRIMSEGLRRTLAGWFNVGLLQLERVTWENTSAAMLEKIASEEKVHSIDNWKVLKSRLGSKRRVFAWTHPSLPGEPLVALHVALCSRVTSTMDEILLKESSARRDENKDRKNKKNDDEEKKKDSSVEDEVEELVSKSEFVPTVAIFYSISNMKRGLSGVDLGNNLIKRAAKELMTELPSLKTLATLSPLPGFSSWVESTLTRMSVDYTMRRKHEEPLLLSPEEKETLKNVLDRTSTKFETGGASGDAELLRHALSLFTSSSSSTTNSDIQNALKSPLLRLAAHYLLNEKHRGRALDSVANFHLRNGAQVYRLNWLADTSIAGMERSYGIMVNYMYDMDAVEENNRKYIMNGEISVSEKF